MKGIADTGFIVAFAKIRDMHHGWAITSPLLCSRKSEIRRLTSSLFAVPVIAVSHS
jgi:hypothetical protein